MRRAAFVRRGSRYPAGAHTVAVYASLRLHCDGPRDRASQGSRCAAPVASVKRCGLRAHAFAARSRLALIALRHVTRREWRLP